MNKLDKIQARFHYRDDDSINLESYGVYRIGLLSDEIDDYLRARGNTLNIKKLRKQFDEIAGCNTMGISPDGKGLMYRWDVERFADKLFFNKQTYWD